MKQGILRLHLAVLGVLLVWGSGCGYLPEEAAMLSSKSETLFLQDTTRPGVVLASYQEPAAFLQHPDIKAAIEQSRFPIHLGNSPPALGSTFALAGSLTETSSQVRAVGARLTSGIFLDTRGTAGQTRFRTCEKSKLTSDGYISITGLSQSSFTLYATWQAPGQTCRAFGLFSGVKASDSWKVEALVIYEKSCQSIGATWERSTQKWSNAVVDCQPPDSSYSPPTPKQSGCPPLPTQGYRNPVPVGPEDPINPRGPQGPSPSCSLSDPNCPDPGPAGNDPDAPTPPGDGEPGNPPLPGAGSGSGSPKPPSGSGGSGGSPGAPSGGGGGGGGFGGGGGGGIP